MAVAVVPALIALGTIPLAGARQRSGASIFDQYKRQSTCAAQVESCSTAASAASTCCVNRPGGQLLQVQFWDTDPCVGASMMNHAALGRPS